VATTPERAFEAFTGDRCLGRPNGLFQFTQLGSGTLAFESYLDGRHTETLGDGDISRSGA
jgi:hypothetical protein